jgi:hypothetical protein
MPMLGDFSLATVGVSAALSICTGYAGTLVNFSRQRNRHRRVYGLSLLAEIKSLQRIFRQHHKIIESGSISSRLRRLPALHFGVADMTVFTSGSANLGLFSTRTAVEVIEFYSAVRALAAQVQILSVMQQEEDTTEDDLSEALARHLWSLLQARRHSRMTVLALRRDIPPTAGETVSYFARRTTVGWRKLRRRLAGRPHSHGALSAFAPLTKRLPRM